MTSDPEGKRGADLGGSGPEDDALRRAFELRRRDLDAVAGEEHRDWDAIRAGFEEQIERATPRGEPRRTRAPWAALATAAALLFGALLAVRLGGDDELDDPLGPALGNGAPAAETPSGAAPARVRLLSQDESSLELELDELPPESGFYSVVVRDDVGRTLFESERHDGQRLNLDLGDSAGPEWIFIEVETWIDWMDGSEPERTEVRSGRIVLGR